MIVTKTFPARKTFNNVFDELFGTFQSNYGNEAKPVGTPVNIAESENGYDIFFNAPGRNKDEFKISVDNGLLTVSYNKTASTETTEVKFIRKEFTNGEFRRTFSLDEKMNAESIEAKYENGILNVFIPKKEEVKNAPRHISIQ